LCVVQSVSSEIGASGVNVFLDGTGLFFDVLSKLSQDIEFSVDFRGVSFVFLRLALTPGSLGSEGELSVFEVGSVVFEGFSEL
jgi:hypothetical protein